MVVEVQDALAALVVSSATPEIRASARSSQSFSCTFGEYADPPYERYECPVVASRMRHNSVIDATWAEPIIPGTHTPFIDEEDYALVMPDGTVHFRTHFDEFAGKTVDEFAAFLATAIRFILNAAVWTARQVSRVV